MNLPVVDVDSEVAERIRARAHGILAANRRASRLDRLETTFVARIEPVLAAAGALAMVCWSVGAALG